MSHRLLAPVAVLVAFIAFGSLAWAGADRKDPDGRYAGEFKSTGGKFGEVTFSVKGDGRSLVGFGGELIGVCYQPGQGPQTETFPFFIGKVRVDSKGDFSKSITVKREPYDQEYVLDGSVVNRKVTGHLALDGLCEVSAGFTALPKR